MATIRQRSGKWQAIVKRKGHPYTVHTFTLRKDAEKWARQQESLIDSGLWVDRTTANQTTLEELLERYAMEVTPLKRSPKAELQRINQYKANKLSKLSVSAITPKLIAELRDDRLKVVSSSTVLRELSLLSHVFTVATRDWGIALQTNPVKLIRKPSHGKPRDRVLNDAERHRLLQECSKCTNPWVLPVVVFALETGARRGEILALERRNLNLQLNTAKLIITKSGARRTIPLSPACIAMLKSLPASIEGKVFPVSIEALKQAYERAVVRAGIMDFTFHDLRHDALTRMAKLGLNVLELRTISGHASANMLQRYVSVDPQELAGRLARLS
jgi:integrase